MRFYLIALFFLLGCNSSEMKFKRISDMANAFIVQMGTQTEYLSIARFGIAPLQTTREDCADIAIDSDGFIYCGGFTNGRIADTQGAGADLFIAKFSPQGEIVWITQLGANVRDVADNGNNAGEDQCINIAVDAQKNVYCAGYTSGNIGGAGMIQGTRDAMVMKLNSNGELQWVTQTGAPGEDAYVKMALAPDGYIYTTGYTLGELVAGERPGLRTDFDMIVSKFDPSGTLVSSVQIGDDTFTNRATRNLSNLQSVTDDDFGRAITMTRDGDIVIAGTAKGSFFGTNVDIGTEDIVLWKLDSSLNTLWSKQHSVSDSQLPTDIIVDEQNNFYLTGNSIGDFGETNGGSGTRDIYVAKFSASGDLTRVSQLGAETPVPGGNTSKDEFAFSIARDRQGSIYVGGRTFGDIGERNADPTNTTTDLLLAKWDADLNFVGAIQFGAVTSTPGGDNTKNDTARGIAIDYFGNLYVGGETFGAFGEPQAGLSDLFIMKIDMSTLDFSAPRF